MIQSNYKEKSNGLWSELIQGRATQETEFYSSSQYEYIVPGQDDIGHI